MTPEIKAIPTKYKGFQMRSRNEARWAAFFDLCGWKWEYEPIDLGGYIPDFVLRFYKPIIVDCKPGWELQQFTDKMDRCGWKQEMLIVGSSLLHTEPGGIWHKLGLLFEPNKEEGLWADANIHRCTECRNISFHHDVFSFHCRVCGAYDGDHYLGPVEEIEIQSIWAHASNAVQWRSKP